MSLQDLTDVVDRVWYWITQSDPKVPNKIAAAYHQKGGWEGWAQVEIAYLIQEKYPNVTIDREVNVYTGTRKENDFVITDVKDATKPKHIVELKCERGTQNPNQFKQSFIDDIDKINNLPISPAYKPARSYAIAISCTPESYKALLETEPMQWGGRKVTSVQCAKTGIYIWFYERDIV